MARSSSSVKVSRAGGTGGRGIRRVEGGIPKNGIGGKTNPGAPGIIGRAAEFGKFMLGTEMKNLYQSTREEVSQKALEKC